MADMVQSSITNTTYLLFELMLKTQHGMRMELVGTSIPILRVKGVWGLPGIQNL